MSTERKNPFKRDQALNDATSGQLGEEPRPGPYPEKDPRMEASTQKVKADLRAQLFFMSYV